MQLSHGRFMSCLMSFQSCLVGIHCCLVCIYCCLMCLVRTRITYGSWRGTAWTDLFSKGRYRAPFEHKTTHILEWWRTSLKQTLTNLSNPWSPGPEVLMKCECELWWQTSWSYLSHPRLALDSMIQLWHAMTTWTTISLQALPLFLKPDLHRQLSGGLWTWANAKQIYDWLRIAKIYPEPHEKNPSRIFHRLLCCNPLFSIFWSSLNREALPCPFHFRSNSFCMLLPLLLWSALGRPCQMLDQVEVFSGWVPEDIFEDFGGFLHVEVSLLPVCVTGLLLTYRLWDRPVKHALKESDESMNIKRNAILHARHAWQSQWIHWIPWYAMNLTAKSSACTGIFSWTVKGFPSDRVRQDFVCPRNFDKSLLCLLRRPKVVPSCGTCHNAWIKSRENITYNYIYTYIGAM